MIKGAFTLANAPCLRLDTRAPVGVPTVSCKRLLALTANRGHLHVITRAVMTSITGSLRPGLFIHM